MYQFGCARPILNQRHPDYVKPTFWFPTLFLLGYVAGILEYFLLQKGFVLACYGFYTLVIFLHALYLTKNIAIAATSDYYHLHSDVFLRLRILES